MEDALDILSDDLFDLPNNIVDTNLLEEIDSLDLFQDFSCDLGADKKCFSLAQYSQIENNSNGNYENVYYEPTQNLPIKTNPQFTFTNRGNYPVEQNIKMANTTQINNFSNPKNYNPDLQYNNPSQNGRTKQQMRNMPKSNFPHIQPILPATSNDIMHNPTLAATLIDSKPCVNISPSHSSDGKYEEEDDTMPVSGKRGVRKNSHNAIEKRYRLSINDKIDELRAMLFDNDDGKMNKSSVLKKAIERIKGLEDNNNALKNENYRLKLSLQQKSNDTQDPCQLMDQASIKSSQYTFSNNINNQLNNNNTSGSSPLSSNPSDDFIDPPLTTSNSGESSNVSGNDSEFGNSPTSNNASTIPFLTNPLKQQQVPIQKIINNSLSTRQLKRPLIYDTQQNNSRYTNPTIKNEKLARLLLGGSNDGPVAARIEPRQPNVKFTTNTKIYQNGSSTTSSLASNTNNQDRSTTTHQQLPSFLLCTCALFIVAFEPISRIKDSYQLKKIMTASGSAGQAINNRHILQYDTGTFDSTGSSSESLWSYLFLTFIQWVLAFMLIRISSRRNRYRNSTKTDTSGIYYYFYLLIRFIHVGIVSLFRYLIDPFKLGAQSTKSRVKLALDEISDSYNRKNDGRLNYSRFMTILSKSNCIIPSRYGKIRLCLQMALLSCSNSISWIFLHTKSTNQTIDCYLEVYTKLVEHINRNETKTELSFIQRAWSRVFLYYLIQLSAKCSCIEKRNMAWFVLLQTIDSNPIRKFILRKWEITSLTTMKVTTGTEFYTEFIKYCKSNKLSSVSNQILDDSFNQLKLPYKIDQLDIYECYYFGFVMEIINESLNKLAIGSRLNGSLHSSILRHIISNSSDQHPNLQNNTSTCYDYLELWCHLLFVIDRTNYDNSTSNDSADGLDIENIELIESLVTNLHDFYRSNGKGNEHVSKYLDFIKTCSRYSIHQSQLFINDDNHHLLNQNEHYPVILQTLSNLIQYPGASNVHTNRVLINLGLTCTFKSLYMTIKNGKDYYRPKSTTLTWKSGVYYSQKILQFLTTNEHNNNANCHLFNSKIKQFSGLLELACDVNPVRNNSMIKSYIDHEFISEQSLKESTDKLSIINSYTNIINSRTKPSRNTKVTNYNSKIMTISNKEYMTNKITEESRLIQ